MSKKTVAFYGSTGSGTSSLINALCGRDVLPRGVSAHTKTVICVDVENEDRKDIVIARINRGGGGVISSYDTDAAACAVLEAMMADRTPCDAIRVRCSFKYAMPIGFILRDVPPHGSEDVDEEESLRRVAESDALVYVVSGDVVCHRGAVRNLMRYAPGHFANMLVTFPNNHVEITTILAWLQGLKDLWHSTPMQLQLPQHRAYVLRNSEARLDDLRHDIITSTSYMVSPLRDPQGALDKFADEFRDDALWKRHSQPLKRFLEKNATPDPEELKQKILEVVVYVYDRHYQNIWYNGRNDVGRHVMDPMRRMARTIVDKLVLPTAEPQARVNCALEEIRGALIGAAESIS